MTDRRNIFNNTPKHPVTVTGDTTGGAKIYDYGSLHIDDHANKLRLHDGVTEGGFAHIPIYAPDATGKSVFSLDLDPVTESDLVVTNPDGSVSRLRVPTKEVAYTALTTLLVTHNLGYYPIVQFLVAGVVTEPTSITHGSKNAFTLATSGSTTGVIIYR